MNYSFILLLLKIPNEICCNNIKHLGLYMFLIIYLMPFISPENWELTVLHSKHFTTLKYQKTNIWITLHSLSPILLITTTTSHTDMH